MVTAAGMVNPMTTTAETRAALAPARISRLDVPEVEALTNDAVAVNNEPQSIRDGDFEGLRQLASPAAQTAPATCCDGGDR